MKTNKPHPVQQEKDNLQTKPMDSEVKAIDDKDLAQYLKIKNPKNRRMFL